MTQLKQIEPGTLNWENIPGKRMPLSNEQKPFIAWDGEGITYQGNIQQAYVMLCNNLGDSIVAPEGQCLSTKQCLDILFRVEEKNPHAIHIGYGFGYDTNQILNSLTKRELGQLRYCISIGRTYSCKRLNFKIKIIPGKLTRFSRGRYLKDKDYVSVTIYDTLGFFQTKFATLVRKFYPDEYDRIQSGKQSRGNFNYKDLRAIKVYCIKECELLVRLMENLREQFENRGLVLRDWYGPGAVANASLQLHNIKSYKADDLPCEIKQAARYAYQGGRFELLRAGYSPHRIWQYDINSAYPSAIIKLPDLATGRWEYKTSFEADTFAIWNIKYSDKRNDRSDIYSRYRANPFFFRNRHGAIAYPPIVEGWYWTPEVEAFLDGYQYPNNFDIKGGWVFHPVHESVRPFAYVEDIYYERLARKNSGDPSERVLKLEMNSLYGKFAQRSGYFKAGDKIPAYHQLEWAGYITSCCRAKVFSAYNLCPGSVFSFETDAVFSVRPLPLEVGSGLGQWSVKEYCGILYLQSGFYFAGREFCCSEYGSAHNSAIHYRGFDKGSLSLDQTYEWLKRQEPRNPGIKDETDKLYGPSNRFIGFKRALIGSNMDIWRSWDTTKREITIGKEGKRTHQIGCPLCHQHMGWHEGLHGMQVNYDIYEHDSNRHSYPHKIPWDYDYAPNVYENIEMMSDVDGKDF